MLLLMFKLSLKGSWCYDPYENDLAKRCPPEGRVMLTEQKPRLFSNPYPMLLLLIRICFRPVRMAVSGALQQALKPVLLQVCTLLKIA